LKPPVPCKAEIQRQNCMSAPPLASAICSVLVAFSSPAWAGYGPSGSVVQSEPPFKLPSIEELTQFSSDRLSRITSNLDGARIDQLLKELKLGESDLDKELERVQEKRESLAQISKDMNSQRTQIEEFRAKLQENDALVGKQEAELAMLQKTLEASKAKSLDLRQQIDLATQYVSSEERIAKEEQESLLKDTFQSMEKQKSMQANLDAELRRRKNLLTSLDAQPAWFNYIAAFIASLGATVIMHPVDTLKTRLMGGNSAEAVEFSFEGLGSLYDGLLGNLVKEGPSSALYLGVYESARSQLMTVPAIADNLLIVYLIAGAAGEFCGSVIRAPAEAVKTKLQSGKDSSFSQSVESVIGTDSGRANIFKAWSASCFRDVPAGAIQIAIFEYAKIAIVALPGTASIDFNSLAFEAFLGATGGGIAALVTTPADVVTTQLITQDPESESKVSSFAEGLQKNFQSGGLEALFLGWKERTAYWTPAIGLFLSFYCSLRQLAVSLQLF